MKSNCLHKYCHGLLAVSVLTCENPMVITVEMNLS